MRNPSAIPPYAESVLYIEHTKPALGLFHGISIILFFALLGSLVLPELYERIEATIALRQAGYAVFLCLLLAIGGFQFRQMGAAELVILGAGVILSFAALVAWLYDPDARLIDLGAVPSYILGLHLFVVVLPRLWGAKTKRILLWALIPLTFAVIASMFARADENVTLRNTLGAYAGIAAVLFLSVTLQSGRMPLRRTVAFLLFCAAVIMLVYSHARTSLVAAGITSMILLWFSFRGWHRVALIFLGLMVLGVLALSPIPDILLNYFVYKGGGSQTSIYTLTGRTDIWRYAFAEADGIIWIGKGRLWIWRLTGGLSAHSSYLGCYFAYGIFGVAAWLTIVLIAIWASLKTLKDRTGSGLPLAPAIIIFFLVIGLAEDYFSMMFGTLGTFFYLATGMALLELRERAGLGAGVTDSGRPACY